MELNWINAIQWQEKVNNSKLGNEPRWLFDCGFKLDFDGELLSIESRFYPPTKTYGENWDGNLRVKLLGSVILEKFFSCETLDKLKVEVESFTKHYKDIVKSKLS